MKPRSQSTPAPRPATDRSRRRRRGALRSRPAEDLPRGVPGPAGLKGVNLEVRGGELLAVTGTSGSGKSTLLHVLGLLTRPTRGRIRYEGRVTAPIASPRARDAAQPRIGFVFQFYTCFRADGARERGAAVDGNLWSGGAGGASGARTARTVALDGRALGPRGHRPTSSRAASASASHPALASCSTLGNPVTP